MESIQKQGGGGGGKGVGERRKCSKDSLRPDALKQKISSILCAFPQREGKRQRKESDKCCKSSSPHEMTVFTKTLKGFN